jgi:hypothetical protein
MLRKVSGDGNCMFRSAAAALFSEGERHIELLESTVRYKHSKWDWLTKLCNTVYVTGSYGIMMGLVRSFNFGKRGQGHT